MDTISLMIPNDLKNCFLLEPASKFAELQGLQVKAYEMLDFRTVWLITGYSVGGK
jgi:hypothetical protein